MVPKSKITAQEEPAASTYGGGPLLALSAREQAIMLQTLLTDPKFPTGIQVDYAKITERMNLKYPWSASNALGSHQEQNNGV
ncbi:hypothetical protein VTI28DRAFT_4635 [Corynascus sepedonium]